MGSGQPRRLPRRRRISERQCRSTFAVLRADCPSQESSSSGRRPMMCQLVEQRGDLRGSAVSHIGCHPQLMHATWLQRPSLAVLLQHCGGPFEERAVSVPDESWYCGPRSAWNWATWGCLKISALPGFLLGEDVARPIFFKHESTDRNVRRDPGRLPETRPVQPFSSLKNAQNLIPDSWKLFSPCCPSRARPLEFVVLALNPAAGVPLLPQGSCRGFVARCQDRALWQRLNR